MPDVIRYPKKPLYNPKYRRKVFTIPFVSVPVLSVQRMSMLPRFSIALRRLTITPRLAISFAPLASVTLNIAGVTLVISRLPKPLRREASQSSGFRNIILRCQNGNYIDKAWILISNPPNVSVHAQTSVSGGASRVFFDI